MKIILNTTFIVSLAKQKLLGSPEELAPTVPLAAPSPIFPQTLNTYTVITQESHTIILFEYIRKNGYNFTSITFNSNHQLLHLSPGMWTCTWSSPLKIKYLCKCFSYGAMRLYSVKCSILSHLSQYLAYVAFGSDRLFNDRFSHFFKELIKEQNFCNKMSENKKAAAA